MLVRSWQRQPMSTRISAVGAWGLCAICLLALSAGLVLEVANRAGPFHEQDTYLGAIVIAVLFPLVGAAIAARQPGNMVGWVFLSMGLSEALVGFTGPYAVYATYTHPGVVPGGALASWFAASFWVPGFGLVVLLLVLFPTGRPPSRPWYAVVWLTLCGTALTVLVSALSSWPYRGVALVASAETVTVPDGSVLALLNVAASVMLLASLLSAATCLVLRCRGSRGVVRQQLKWCAYSTAMATIVLLVSVLLLPNGGYLNGRLLDTLVVVLQATAFAAIPVSVGVAILRYRLFDIDLIINRTLVYGSLTALLAGVYFGSVLVLQHVAIALSGQRAGANPLILVLSTLLIAALFQPLRVRLQRVIDRRFYRQKYDAAKTLARFAETLRGEVDLADLQGHLMGVVEETLQPAHVSLWIATPSAPVARNL